MNKKPLLNNKGMSLVEVMMAVAVFGIILLFVTQMTNTSSRLTADNIEQMQMAEVAHNVAEDIKAAKKITDIEELEELESAIKELENAIEELENSIEDTEELTKPNAQLAELVDRKDNKIAELNAFDEYLHKYKYKYPIDADKDIIIKPDYQTGTIKMNVGTIPMDVNNPDNFQLVIWIPWLEGLDQVIDNE